MTASKPLIGVTGSDEGGAAAWWFSRLAIYRAGGGAVRISPSKRADFDRLEGLVVGGGADLDPALYGEEKIELAMEVIRKKRSLAYTAKRIFFYPLVYFVRKIASLKSAVAVDKKRDALEYFLIEKSLEKNLPILGICRGAQMINVFSGGTLHQDLRQFYAEIPQYHSIFPRKTVRLRPDSRLGRICKKRRMKVNALHRQAIDRTGENLRLVAVESNGVVQAVEHRHRPFVIGVQWHPEYLPQHPAHQAIFTALVRACRAKIG